MLQHHTQVCTSRTPSFEKYACICTYVCIGVSAGMSGRQGEIFVRWRLIFVGPQHGTCVTPVAPRILRWLLDFGKSCTPLCKRTNFCLHKEHPCRCSIHNACRCFQSHRTLFVIVRCLAASFDLQYRSSSDQLYKNRTKFGGILW